MDSLSPAFRNAGFWTGLFLPDDFAAFGPVYNDAFFVRHFQFLFSFFLPFRPISNLTFSIPSHFYRLELFKISMVNQKQIALVISSFRLT